MPAWRRHPHPCDFVTVYAHQGVPTHDADGEPLGKGPRKKAVKQWMTQVRKYTKKLQKEGDTEQAAAYTARLKALQQAGRPAKA